MIRIEILGDAIPAARPRYSRGRVYQPKRNAEYRERIQAACRDVMGSDAPLECEVKVRVKVYRKYKRGSRLFGDVDNHLKAIFDGMNKIVFADDAQVVYCEVQKHVDKEHPRTEIEIFAV